MRDYAKRKTWRYQLLAPFDILDPMKERINVNASNIVQQAVSGSVFNQMLFREDFTGRFFNELLTLVTRQIDGV